MRQGGWGRNLGLWAPVKKTWSMSWGSVQGRMGALWYHLHFNENHYVPCVEKYQGDRVVDPNRLTRQSSRRRGRSMGKKTQLLTKWNQSEGCKSILGPSTSVCWWTRLVECGETLGDVGKLFKRCRRQAGGGLVPGWTSRVLFGSQGSSAILHRAIGAPTAGNGFRAPLVISGPLGRKSCL